MHNTYHSLENFHLELLNQAHAGHRPARAWFLKVEPVRIVSMCMCVCLRVCVSTPEAINN